MTQQTAIKASSFKWSDYCEVRTAFKWGYMSHDVIAMLLLSEGQAGET
jgi:hypothetical protein